MAVLMGNNMSVKKADINVVVTKMAFTIQYFAARLKPRSLWNYEIKFVTESWPN